MNKSGRTLRPGASFGMTLVIILAVMSASFRQRTDPAGSQENAAVNPTSLPSKPLRKARLLPYWVPAAQFAGYYVGIEKGIFRKHGIDLELLSFDSQVTTEAAFQSRSTDFAMLWLVNALEVRSKGTEIVNIAQFSYRSSLMLITKKSSGIERLEDMDGKRAGIWLGYERQPQALFRKFNLDVEIVPIGSSNNLFLFDAVQILNANWFDEYHSILNNGLNEDELNKFFFADYGLNFLEDGLYCLDETVKRDPDLCRDFVKAAMESWLWAFEHQDEAVNIVVTYARAHNQPVNKPHQKWMLSHYRDLYIPAGSTKINNNLKREDYETIHRILLDGGFISQPVAYESFYQPVTGQ
jgi:NitT/TauT family transport system substrate-binding protein